MPQLIGKAGVTINKLMKDSKAKIVVRQQDGKESDVIITGTPRNVMVRVVECGGFPVVVVCLVLLFGRERGGGGLVSCRVLLSSASGSWPV